MIPADINRIIKQLEAVSGFVDTVLVYQYLGIMNKPGTQAFAGHSGSSQFYIDYVNWLKAVSTKER